MRQDYPCLQTAGGIHLPQRDKTYSFGQETMKKEEIIQKQGQTKRLLARFLMAMLVLTGILATVAGTASPAHLALTGNICIIVLVTCVLGGIVWIGRLTDIRCPLCKKSIQGGIQAPLALTTGKCGHCGERIIDETEAEQANPTYRR